MHARLLSTAFVMSCLIVVPYVALGQSGHRGARPEAGDGGGSRGAGRVDGRARGSTPRGTTIASGRASERTTTEKARGGRSRVGRPLAVIALPYAETESNEPATPEPDIVPSPSTALPYTYSEPSSIQPLQPSALPQPSRPSARGTLRLEIEPETAQVYVDGFYVGTVDALNRSAPGLNIAAGWHRLEFRAPGYETPAINVTIEANRTTTYRGGLKPMRP